MYATCLFCKSALGRNEALEHFPVGRRLAYDETKGRLWVICRRCERWNLTPLETRWEAIEEAERAFRATRLRISTDNIGLARLKEGLELVRIGAPPRLELATWRYGDQFGRRRRKTFAVTGLGMAASALVIVPSLGLGVGVTTVGFAAYLTHMIMDHRKFQKDRNVPTIFVTDDDGEVLPLAKWDTWTATLVPITDSQKWQLKVHHRVLEPTVRRARLFWRKQAREQSAKPAILTGARAQRALAAPVLEQRWREAEDMAAIAGSLLIAADTDSRVDALRRQG